MTIGERIKEIRLALGQNQREFSKTLDISQPALAMLETGQRDVNKRHISIICMKHGINRDWLEKGEGEMYEIPIEEEAEIISELIEKDNPIYDLVKDIVRKYKKLDPKSKKVLEDFCQDLMSKDERRSK